MYILIMYKLLFLSLFPNQCNYVHSIHIILGIISNLRMSESMWEIVCTLDIPCHIIQGFEHIWMFLGFLGQSPKYKVEMKLHLFILFHSGHRNGILPQKGSCLWTIVRSWAPDFFRCTKDTDLYVHQAASPNYGAQHSTWIYSSLDTRQAPQTTPRGIIL